MLFAPAHNQGRFDNFADDCTVQFFYFANQFNATLTLNLFETVEVLDLNSVSPVLGTKDQGYHWDFLV
jgi:hypothetical protein